MKLPSAYARRLGCSGVPMPEFGDDEPHYRAKAEPPPTAIRYLGKNAVARRLGLKDYDSMKGVRLPPPDAVIDNRAGWLPETIDAWAATRPGSGRWGAR